MRGVGHQGQLDDLFFAVCCHTQDLVTHAEVILHITAALQGGGGDRGWGQGVGTGSSHTVHHPPGVLLDTTWQGGLQYTTPLGCYWTPPGKGAYSTPPPWGATVYHPPGGLQYTTPLGGYSIPPPWGPTVHHPPGVPLDTTWQGGYSTPPPWGITHWILSHHCTTECPAQCPARTSSEGSSVGLNWQKIRSRGVSATLASTLSRPR